MQQSLFVLLFDVDIFLWQTIDNQIIILNLTIVQPRRRPSQQRTIQYQLHDYTVQQKITQLNINTNA